MPRSGPGRWRQSVWSRWWCGAAEGGFQPLEQARKRVGLGRVQVGQQPCEAFPELGLSRAQCPLSLLGQGERLSAAVVGEALALEQAGALERCEQLRDGGRRDSGAPGEFGADDLALADRL
jgi:hypothetical protein